MKKRRKRTDEKGSKEYKGEKEERGQIIKTGESTIPLS